jgi:hypothetical protein
LAGVEMKMRTILLRIRTEVGIPASAKSEVAPTGRLKELFDALHDLTDIDEAMRLSALHQVDFVR